MTLGGKVGKAQTKIINELTKEFGKQSEIQGYAMSIRQLDTAVGNLAKRMGADLRDAIEPLIKSLAEFVNNLDASEIFDFIKSVAGITLAFQGLKKALSLGLLFSGKNIKSFSKLSRVLKNSAKVSLGLKSTTLGAARALRTATVATKAMHVALSSMMGATGIGLLVSFLLPAFIGLWKDGEDAIDGVAKTLPDAEARLRELDAMTSKTMITASGYAKILTALGIPFSRRIKDTEYHKGLLFEYREELVKNIKTLQSLKKGNEDLGDGEDFVHSKITELTNSLRDQHFTMNATIDANGNVIKGHKRLAKAIISTKAHIDIETGAVMDWEDAVANLNPTIAAWIARLNGLEMAIDSVKVEKRADIEETKLWDKAYQDMFASLSNQITNFLEFDLNRWKEGEISKLEAQKDTIESTVRNEKRKAIELGKIDKKIESIEKKAYNRALILKGIELSLDYAQSLAKIHMAAATANALALLLPPGLQQAQQTIIQASKAASIAAATVGYGIGLAGLAAKKAASGADFETSGPQMMLVGDNPGGRERVQVTPLSSPNIEGPQGGGANVTVNISAPLVDDTVVDTIIPAINEAVRKGEFVLSSMTTNAPHG